MAKIKKPTKKPPAADLARLDRPSHPPVGARVYDPGMDLMRVWDGNGWMPEFPTNG